MSIKVGINGFGRIGRMVFRAAVENFNDVEIVGINDLLDPEYLAYMLKYDSVHGKFNHDIKVEGNTMYVDGKAIRLTAEKDPAQLKWNEIGAEVVVESTGLFLTKEKAQLHIDAGAKKVIMSELPGAPRQGRAREVRHQARPHDHRPRRHRHPEDRRRPLQEGLARRPPVVDLTCELEKPATYEEICAAMKEASEGELKGILGYTDEAVVSTDFRGEPCTSTFDAKAGIQLDPTFVKLVSWYDNEWGYSNKVVEMIRVIAK